MTFEADLSTHRRQLFSYAIRMTRDHAAAEDLVQDTFLKALKHRDKYQEQGPDSLMGWLAVIQRRTFYTDKRMARHRYEAAMPEMADHDHMAGMAMPASQEAGIDLSRVLNAIADMPAMYRDALVSAAEGASYDDLVEETGMSLSSVKKHRFRGRLYLEQKLGGMDFESDGVAMAALQAGGERPLS